MSLLSEIEIETLVCDSIMPGLGHIYASEGSREQLLSLRGHLHIDVGNPRPSGLFVRAQRSMRHSCFVPWDEDLMTSGD